jgi:hypothetical protein
LLLARERRRIAHPKAQSYADFETGLQQRFATGEMGFNDQFAPHNRSGSLATFARVRGGTNEQIIGLKHQSIRDHS